jgi:hypothetical protein
MSTYDVEERRLRDWAAELDRESRRLANGWGELYEEQRQAASERHERAQERWRLNVMRAWLVFGWVLLVTLGCVLMAHGNAALPR